MSFKVTQTPIDGVMVIEPMLHTDTRGYFMETYCEQEFRDLGIGAQFIQDNHSLSHRGVLRGLHFQTSNSQGKLIRVIAGAVYDVAVDLRPESTTFGRWFGILLSAQNRLQMYVPPRFGHGFLTLEDNTEFLYKCTHYYNPATDGGILWSDPEIGIEWPLTEFGIVDVNLSEKDLNRPKMNQIKFDTLWE